MKTSWVLGGLLGMLGCGRLDFGEIDLAFEASLVTGAYTFDARMCLNRPATLKYVVSTTPWPSGWTAEDLERRKGESSVVAHGTSPGLGECNVVTTRVDLPETDLYLYAMTGESESALLLSGEDKGRMHKVFELRRFDFSIGFPVQYWVHYPEAYYRAPDKLRPTVLYLHGAGSNGNSNGDNLTNVIEEGMPLRYGVRADDMIDLPFILYAPQCNQTEVDCQGWSSPRLPAYLDETLADLESIGAPVDERRFYVTGLSTGGEGAWRYAIHRPELVSAIVPIASTSTNAPTGFYDQRLCEMADVAVWAFHNSRDTAQSPGNSQALEEKLEVCGDTQTQLDLGDWQFPPDGHGGWTLVYDGTHGFENRGVRSIYEWMLAHEKP